MTSILRASVSLAIATAIVKMSSFLKDIAQAGTFGTTVDLDAFLIVSMLFGLVGNVVGGSMGVAAAPQIAAAREKANSGKLLTSTGLKWSILATTVISVLLVAFHSTVFDVIGLQLPQGSEHLATLLFLAMAFQGIAGGVSQYLQIILNADGEFFRPGIVPLLPPLVQLLYLMQPYLLVSIVGFAIVTTAALVSQATILYLISTSNSHNRQSAKKTDFDKTSVKLRVLPAIAISISSILVGCTDLFIGAKAASIGAGIVSSLNYATKYPSLVSTFVLSTVVAATYPRLISLAATGNTRALIRLIGKMSIMLAMAGMIAWLILFVFGDWLVRTTFQRGRFDAESVSLVASLQLLVALQFPLAFVGMILTRANSAVSATRTMILSSAATLACTATYTTFYVSSATDLACVYLVLQFCAVTVLGFGLVHHVIRVSR